MDPEEFTFEDAEAYLQARGTPAERAMEAIEAFSELARAGDERAARTILAQLENKDASDPTVRKNLDPNKVEIVKTAVGSIRRGTAVDLVVTALASGLGVAAGYLSHKIIDWRPGGFPVNALPGVVGVAAGVSGVTDHARCPHTDRAHCS